MEEPIKKFLFFHKDRQIESLPYLQLQSMWREVYIHPSEDEYVKEIKTEHNAELAKKRAELTYIVNPEWEAAEPAERSYMPRRRKSD